MESTQGKNKINKKLNNNNNNNNNNSLIYLFIRIKNLLFHIHQILSQY